jgi:hypothetical protein
MKFRSLVISEARFYAMLPLLQRKQDQDAKRLLIAFDYKTRKRSDRVKKFKMDVDEKPFI